ncbi:hypothetical protein SAMN04489867_3325 [Pedococcus dokdonensis]|uniref:Uncharacterized protein n=1 Tax=Pedococcus dokdonensis TaxID=443156 RepID=A0A1H0UHA9_9MICO|nr:hypothetical protein [Pedococcus dokdonensis]SDP65564.1 hypothetical protein SAMN04489867_3325 [Pedococcus dokdonensis]
MTTARRQPAKKVAKPARKAAATRGSAPSTPKAAAVPTSDAIVLTGPPGLLRATVSVENAVDQRVAVRGLTLHRAGREALSGTGAAVIAPGATAELPVTFRLEPDTPPGDYPAEVEVGGIRREAVLRVEPDLALHVSPRRMLAEVGSSEVTLTVTNDGNVPMSLAAVVRARTDDGGPDPGPDVTLTLARATTVAAGSTSVLGGTLAVPEELDPTRRHTARVPVGTADLDVIILPRDASE